VPLVVAVGEFSPVLDTLSDASRVPLTEFVCVKLSARLAVIVAELKCVLVPLLEALDVGVTVSIGVRIIVPETVEVILGLRLGMPTVPEIVVEDEDVLLGLNDCVLFPELVELCVIAALLVKVFVKAPLRDPVEEADGDLLADIVRVPLALPVPVFEAVIVEV
jgi:hypothetical protein